MGRRVARVRVDRELERRLRLVVVAERSVEHREVVVGLGKLRKVLGEAGEDLDRLVDLLLLGEDESAEEAALRLARLCLEVGVHAFHRRLEPALRVELLRLAQVVGGCGGGATGECQREGDDDDGQAQVAKEHRVIIY